MSNISVGECKKGIVTFYNAYGGYGFIQFNNGDGLQDIYTHYSKFIKCKRLKVGQYVRFTIGESDRGLIAENVELIFGGNKNAKVKTNT